MYLSFVAIPLIVIMFYGLEDKNADYFKKGRFITNSEGYEYRYQGIIYHNGLMVSHWSLIAVLSIVFCLISWVTHEGIIAEIKSKK